MMVRFVHPYLNRSIFVLITVAVISVVCVGVSYMYMDAMAQDEASAKRAMKIWKNKIDSSRKNNNIIDEYESSYLTLVDHNVIGPEDRLSWYEVIQATSESRGMPSVKYSVGSQSMIDSRVVQKQFKGVELYRSAMSMDIKMGHEGDLFALLNNLERKANGLFVVDSCDIERVDLKAGKDDSRIPDNYKAYCELSWYTIRATKKGKK